MKKRKVGRPQCSKRNPSINYDTMAAAAAAMDIPLEVLKSAKRAGCPMFKGGRVQSIGLKKWIADNKEAVDKAAVSTGHPLKDQKTLEEIRKLKLANDEDEKLLIRREKVVETHSKILGQLLPRLEQLLTNELPPLMVGLDVVQLRIKGAQVYDSIQQAFRDAGELWRGV